MDNHDKIMINFTGPWRLEWFRSGWLYLTISQQSSSAKWIRTREMWDFKTESVWSSGQWSVWTVRPRTVSVTSEGRASDHVYCGPVLPDSKRRPGPNSSETSTRSRKLSASLVIKKTFIMKTFKHEDIQMDIQIWCPASKEATLLPEDPTARRSSNIPSPIFCPSLELSSNGISYVA